MAQSSFQRNISWGFRWSVTQTFFVKNISRGFRGSVTESFFQKNISRGFRGSVTQLFFQKNISRGFRGSVTELFFKVQNKKSFAGVSRVYHKLKNIFVRFRGGFAGVSRPPVQNWNFLALWKTRQYAVNSAFVCINSSYHFIYSFCFCSIFFCNRKYFILIRWG